MTDLVTPDPATPAPATGPVTDPGAKEAAEARERRRASIERMAVMTASSLSAVLIALLISSLLLMITGKNPGDVFSTMADVAGNSRFRYETVERAVPLVISAIAFAVAAKMNLFNIGVQGQYLIGMFWAAVIGAEVDLPAVLHIPFILLVAMAAGAAWAGIAGFLLVRLNVSEVISTIMLNAIALSLMDWLFNDHFRHDDGTGSLDVRTKELPESAWFPDLVDRKLNSFLIVMIIVAIAYYVLVNRSRFGFRLRASGLNPLASRTSGNDSGKMVMIAMLISGAIAGLAGMQYLLGDAHSYGPARPDSYGFNGLSVALLGRNHPFGIILAALLWGFLDSAAGPLQLADIPRSIVLVMQGIMLFSVVIVNGVVGRWYTRRTTEQAAARLSAEVTS